MRHARTILILLFLLLAACAGRPPVWIGGESEKYPAAVYLTGVGSDADRGRAEDRARAEIAKIFRVEILARDSSGESHWLARAGSVAEEEYRQQVQAELTATTDKVLAGVRIAEVWQEKKTEKYYALAVLDRLRAAQALRYEIDEIDREAASLVRQAEVQTSPLRRLGRYLAALRALDGRRGLAADLRIVDPSGLVPEPPFAPAEIAARVDRSAADIRIGVEFAQDRDGIVRGSLVRALAGLGLQLAPPLEQDLLVRGDVSIERYVAAPWHWAVASAQVEFVAADGSVLEALRTSAREGSQIESRAETVARERLGEKLAVLLVERLGTLPGSEE